MTDVIDRDRNWADLAAMEPEARRSAMMERSQALLGMPEAECAAHARSMIDAEYALPDTDLTEFTASRLGAWAEIARDNPEGARMLNAAYDQAFTTFPAGVAMKRAFAEQTAMTRLLSADDLDALMQAVPALARHVPIKHVSAHRARDSAKAPPGWRRLLDALPFIGQRGVAR